MSFRNLTVIIILGLIILCAIAGEGYFYFYSQKQNNAANAIVQSIQNSLKAKYPADILAEAKNNLQAQTEKLKEMSANFPSSPLLDSAIKKDVAAAALTAAKADSLAALLKLDPIKEANIIALGQKATGAIAYLQSLATTPASTLVLNDAAQNAVELVAAYSNELSAYTNSLTPANSSLTSGEIANYQSQADNIVAEVNVAENSLNQIDNIPASSVAGITSNNGQLAISNDQVNTNSTTTTSQAPNSNQPTGGQVPNNNQIPSNNTSSTSTSIPYTLNPTPSTNNQESNTNNQIDTSGSGAVTLGDITNQETVVSQIANQVNQLSNQAAAEATSSPVSSSTPSPSDSVNNNNGIDNGSYNGDNGNSNQLQVQSGPIKLIEGENSF